MCITKITSEDALTERLFQSAIQTLELYGVYLGKRLGLYEVLHKEGRCNPLKLGEKASIDPRYAREWLEQQAVSGFLLVDDTGRDPYAREYWIPEDHAGVLVEDHHAAHVAPFAQMVAGIGQALPEVVKAYQTGEGVPYEKYGMDFRHGQGGINKPAFLHDLTHTWLPSLPELHHHLQNGEDVRIADIGCGEGWSAIALAKAYPKAEVTGFDLDAKSIKDARANAAEAQVEVAFYQEDASHAKFKNKFDLVLILETLHDMAQPTKALENLRHTLKPGGCVIIADERVAETFYAPGDAIERMMYGWSIVHCLPVAMAEKPSEAIGTAIRPEQVRECATNAGFKHFEILPIANDLFRFYLLLD